MAARIIEPNEPIEVQNLCCLIYGQPGARKSSLAQTAENPITLAFDPGIYRAYGRKKAAMFDTWGDVVAFDTNGHATVVVDTAGMALEKLGQSIVAESPKNGNRLGGLSLQGYGVLKTQFAAWVNTIRSRKQDIVFIAHEKAEKQGDEPYYCPDIVGGSYTTLMNHCDLVGYMHFDNGKKVVDFAPTDRWMAKTPPCGWKQIVLPDFAEQPDFFAKLIAEAKASMGRISAAGAAIAETVAAWQKKITEGDPNLKEFNAILPELSSLDPAAKPQVWHVLKAHAERVGWVYDSKSKSFAKAKEAA